MPPSPSRTRFLRVREGLTPQPDSFELQLMGWNDWFHWRTLYYLTYRDAAGTEHDIGAVKIAQLGHVYGNMPEQATPIPDDFTRLGQDYVSVAQDESFYINLRRWLDPERVRAALRVLGDMSLHPDRVDNLQQENPVISRSLLRSVSAVTVKTTFPRLIQGLGLSPYEFKFHRPSPSLFAERSSIAFSVVPNSTPPTNVHVLIGRNGSGKTTTLREMALAMLGPDAGVTESRFEDSSGGVLDIANLVYVAFSAFDEAVLPVLDDEFRYNVRYSYVGLLAPAAETSIDPDLLENSQTNEVLAAPRKTLAPDDLGDSFARSAWVVIREKSRDLWREALSSLESDPIFAEAEVVRLADIGPDQNHAEFLARAKWLFDRLSSGHKIVLLTVTRLVQTVTERSMVLLDEPEGHLHPPLLSAFIRTLSDLMAKRNGVAIIATHSPVILQEVPKSCAWRISRVSDVHRADPLEIETFGENIGVLTTSVFGLEVADSGFHKLLIQAAVEHRDYDAVLALFGGELGSDARALLHSWFTDQRIPITSHEARRASWRQGDSEVTQ